MSTLLVLSRPFLTLSLDLGFVPSVQSLWNLDRRQGHSHNPDRQADRGLLVAAPLLPPAGTTQDDEARRLRRLVLLGTETPPSQDCCRT